MALPSKSATLAAVVDAIRKGGDRSAFPTATYPLLPGWSYRNMWWVTNNANGAFAARGVPGQAIYVESEGRDGDRGYASFPMAANAFNDPTSLPAYQAMADHLVANPR
jgi:hypothetical protein